MLLVRALEVLVPPESNVVRKEKLVAMMAASLLQLQSQLPAVAGIGVDAGAGGGPDPDPDPDPDVMDVNV